LRRWNVLDLNTIRAAFARDLAADPLRHGLDRAFAAAVERAYRQGLADAALDDGIYHHTGCDWRDEQSGLPVDCAEFWWIAETDLTDRLPLPAPELEAAA